MTTTAEQVKDAAIEAARLREAHGLGLELERLLERLAGDPVVAEELEHVRALSARLGELAEAKSKTAAELRERHESELAAIRLDAAA